jgi:hypothetical protein
VSAADDAPERPPLRLVRGTATPEELAALVAVLSAASADSPDGPATGRRPRSGWASPAHALRRPLAPGHGAWRASGLPR